MVKIFIKICVIYTFYVCLWLQDIDVFVSKNLKYILKKKYALICLKK